MRDIRFRAWDGKKMFNVDVLAISSCTWDCPDHGKKGVSLAYQPSIKVMQYTGLVDKNGKEIYEGDAVKVTHEDGDSDVYTIEYHADRGYPAFDLVPDLECDSNGLSHVMACCEIEVIGNIYENQDLIERG